MEGKVLHTQSFKTGFLLSTSYVVFFLFSLFLIAQEEGHEVDSKIDVLKESVLRVDTSKVKGDTRRAQIQGAVNLQFLRFLNCESSGSTHFSLRDCKARDRNGKELSTAESFRVLASMYPLFWGCSDEIKNFAFENFRILYKEWGNNQSSHFWGSMKGVITEDLKKYFSGTEQDFNKYWGPGKSKEERMLYPLFRLFLNASSDNNKNYFNKALEASKLLSSEQGQPFVSLKSLCPVQEELSEEKPLKKITSNVSNLVGDVLGTRKDNAPQGEIYSSTSTDHSRRPLAGVSDLLPDLLPREAVYNPKSNLKDEERATHFSELKCYADVNPAVANSFAILQQEVIRAYQNATDEEKKNFVFSLPSELDYRSPNLTAQFLNFAQEQVEKQKTNAHTLRSNKEGLKIETQKRLRTLRRMLKYAQDQAIYFRNDHFRNDWEQWHSQYAHPGNAERSSNKIQYHTNFSDLDHLMKSERLNPDNFSAPPVDPQEREVWVLEMKKRWEEIGAHFYDQSLYQLRVLNKWSSDLPPEDASAQYISSLLTANVRASDGQLTVQQQAYADLDKINEAFDPRFSWYTKQIKEGGDEFKFQDKMTGHSSQEDSVRSQPIAHELYRVYENDIIPRLEQAIDQLENLETVDWSHELSRLDRFNARVEAELVKDGTELFKQEDLVEFFVKTVIEQEKAKEAGSDENKMASLHSDKIKGPIGTSVVDQFAENLLASYRRWGVLEDCGGNIEYSQEALDLDDQIYEKTHLVSVGAKEAIEGASAKARAEKWKELKYGLDHKMQALEQVEEKISSLLDQVACQEDLPDLLWNEIYNLRNLEFNPQQIARGLTQGFEGKFEEKKQRVDKELQQTQKETQKKKILQEAAKNKLIKIQALKEALSGAEEDLNNFHGRFGTFREPGRRAIRQYAGALSRLEKSLEALPSSEEEAGTLGIKLEDEVNRRIIAASDQDGSDPQQALEKISLDKLSQIKIRDENIDSALLQFPVSHQASNQDSWSFISNPSENDFVSKEDTIKTLTDFQQEQQEEIRALEGKYEEYKTSLSQLSSSGSINEDFLSQHKKAQGHLDSLKENIFVPSSVALRPSELLAWKADLEADIEFLMKKRAYNYSDESKESLERAIEKARSTLAALGLLDFRGRGSQDFVRPQFMSRQIPSSLDARPFRYEFDYPLVRQRLGLPQLRPGEEYKMPEVIKAVKEVTVKSIEAEKLKKELNERSAQLKERMDYAHEALSSMLSQQKEVNAALSSSDLLFDAKALESDLGKLFALLKQTQEKGNWSVFLKESASEPRLKEVNELIANIQAHLSGGAKGVGAGVLEPCSEENPRKTQLSAEARRLQQDLNNLNPVQLLNDIVYRARKSQTCSHPRDRSNGARQYKPPSYTFAQARAALRVYCQADRLHKHDPYLQPILPGKIPEWAKIDPYWTGTEGKSYSYGNDKRKRDALMYDRLRHSEKNQVDVPTPLYQHGPQVMVDAMALGYSVGGNESSWGTSPGAHKKWNYGPNPLSTNSDWGSPVEHISDRGKISENTDAGHKQVSTMIFHNGAVEGPQDYFTDNPYAWAIAHRYLISLKDKVIDKVKASQKEGVSPEDKQKLLKEASQNFEQMCGASYYNQQYNYAIDRAKKQGFKTDYDSDGKSDYVKSSTFTSYSKNNQVDDFENYFPYKRIEQIFDLNDCAALAAKHGPKYDEKGAMIDGSWNWNRNNSHSKAKNPKLVQCTYFMWQGCPLATDETALSGLRNRRSYFAGTKGEYSQSMRPACRSMFEELYQQRDILCPSLEPITDVFDAKLFMVNPALEN